ncbi:MAG TPA: hypothetical protein VHD56_11905 [Tepidisphaeraceae bacterium]|nr:hypothetical protein [Tepidisphaeraceae bacterium]
MTNTKKQVRDAPSRLPDNCSLEDVQHELYVIEKVRRGLDEVKQGKGISHISAKKRLGK